MTDIITDISASEHQNEARAPFNVEDNYGQDTIYRHPQEGGRTEPASKAPIIGEENLTEGAIELGYDK